MNSKLLFHKALTMCLTFALLASFSMVALAIDGKATGEITVTGSGDLAVTVNGEAVKSGRTIFSSSTITTPDGARAFVNLGKAGRVEIAPSTTFTVSFDKTVISGELAAGSVTVIDAANSVSVKTSSGETVILDAGETASASSSNPSPTAAASSVPSWFTFALIFGGALAGIAIATSQDNENSLGGSASTVSPIR